MRKRVSVLILSLTLSLLFLTSLAYGDLSDVLRVSFIDVGQGDSIWLHASDDTDILIDGGLRGADCALMALLQYEANHLFTFPSRVMEPGASMPHLHRRVSYRVVRVQLRQRLGDLE